MWQDHLRPSRKSHIYGIRRVASGLSGLSDLSGLSGLSDLVAASVLSDPSDLVAASVLSDLVAVPSWEPPMILHPCSCEEERRLRRVSTPTGAAWR